MDLRIGLTNCMDIKLSSLFLPLCFIAATAFSCGDSDKKADSAAPPPLDLTEALSEAEARAGVVIDESALFGGISAEGRSGDIKIYNNRVQFVIQAPGGSSYYIGYGGSVVDADMIRPEGQPGQDLIDDGCTMVGLGRMFNAETVTVVNDGSDGEPAVVRAVGSVEPLTILTGTLEADGLIQDRDVRITNDYILEPDSQLLKIETSVEWRDVSTPVQLADMIFVAADAASDYKDTVGRTGPTPDSYGWTAMVGDRNEGALAILQGPEHRIFEANSVLETVGDLGPLLLGSNPTVDLVEGDTAQWVRYWAVGPDIATIVDAWHDELGTETELIDGAVEAAGAPVPGARVHILDADQRPISMAVTDADGRFSARTPTGSAASVVAESRGPAVYFDGQPGAGWYSPYAAESVREQTLRTVAQGAPPIPHSPGFGVGATTEAGQNLSLELPYPGQLNVQIADGGAAVVRVAFAEEDPIDAFPAVAHSRPEGYAAWAYVTDGAMQIPLEEGRYSVVVHRGTTHEAFSEDVTVSAGETTLIEAELIASVDTTNFRSIDPHSHAAPSGDGGIPMEGRLIVTAAHGVDIHVGTDHDHIADYRVLLEPLGLTDRLMSIVANEVSPSIRGHHNAYPLETAADETNGGAFRWWETWKDWRTTEGFFARVRAMKSDGDIIVQANHPRGSAGLFTNAAYDPTDGTVAKSTHWSNDFDAMEVLNDGGHTAVFPYYLDLLNRGLNPTPVGVSDSHDHIEGMGVNRTWMPLSVNDPSQVTNDHVRQGILEGGTIASLGPLVVPTVDGEWAAGATLTGPVNLDLEIRTPSWMTVDTIHLYENGTEIETIAIDTDSATLRLEPTADAVYVVTVTGEDDMAPAYPGLRPWALVQGIFIDADGDGWTPPLPSISFD